MRLRHGSSQLSSGVASLLTRLFAQPQKKLVQVIKRSGMGGQMAIIAVLLVRTVQLLCGRLG